VHRPLRVAPFVTCGGVPPTLDGVCGTTVARSDGTDGDPADRAARQP
jgi:hypothetical protein